MQLNSNSVVVAPRLLGLPGIERREATPKVKRPAGIRLRQSPLEAWERALWLSLATSAIWALCLAFV